MGEAFLVFSCFAVLTCKIQGYLHRRACAGPWHLTQKFWFRASTADFGHTIYVYVLAMMKLFLSLSPTSDDKGTEACFCYVVEVGVFLAGSYRR